MGKEQCVGLGWQPIVKKAIEEIEAKGGTILQVKEKFGGLRLYCAGDDGSIFDIADKAERDCENLCEDCGIPGKKRSDAWIRTLCDGCHEKDRARFNRTVEKEG